MKIENEDTILKPLLFQKYYNRQHCNLPDLLKSLHDKRTSQKNSDLLPTNLHRLATFSVPPKIELKVPPFFL